MKNRFLASVRSGVLIKYWVRKKITPKFLYFFPELCFTIVKKFSILTKSNSEPISLRDSNEATGTFISSPLHSGNFSGRNAFVFIYLHAEYIILFPLCCADYQYLHFNQDARTHFFSFSDLRQNQYDIIPHQ